MAPKNSIPHEDLGKTLQTFGGKSLLKLYGGAALIGAAALAAFSFAIANMEYRTAALAIAGVLVVFLILYIVVNIVSVRTKVEVCEHGMHVFKRDDVTSLRWDEVDWIEVARTTSLKGKVRWGVSIHRQGGACVDLGPAFWDAAGEPSKFVNVVRRFVPRVEMA
jgi:hypothetical protein